MKIKNLAERKVNKRQCLLDKSAMTLLLDSKRSNNVLKIEIFQSEKRFNELGGE